MTRSLMLLLAASTLACDLGPTAPEVKPPLNQSVTYALFGVVSEMTASGLAPVDGVLVEIESCPHALTATGCAGYPMTNTTTDKNGAYTFPALYGTSGNFTSSTYVWVTKDGYTPFGSGWIGSGTCFSENECSLFLTLTADTRLDVQLYGADGWHTGKGGGHL